MAMEIRSIRMLLLICTCPESAYFPEARPPPSPMIRFILVQPTVFKLLAALAPALQKLPWFNTRVTTYKVQGCASVPQVYLSISGPSSICSGVKSCGGKPAAGPETILNAQVDGFVSTNYIVRFEYDFADYQIPFIGESFYPAKTSVPCQ